MTDTIFYFITFTRAATPRSRLVLKYVQVIDTLIAHGIKKKRICEMRSPSRQPFLCASF